MLPSTDDVDITSRIIDCSSIYSVRLVQKTKPAQREGKAIYDVTF